MMKNNATEYFRGWRRRAIGAVGALLLAASAVAVTASAASAQMACHWPPEGGSNTCLTIVALGNDVYSIHVGIDVHMSQQEAQAIIDANGGAPFGALIMADDEGYDTTSMFEVPATWVVAGEGGLSAEFDLQVGSDALNEDKDGRDEVYARVILYDPRYYPTPRIFESGQIAGYW
jgi:hypothetical protein